MMIFGMILGTPVSGHKIQPSKAKFGCRMMALYGSPISNVDAQGQFTRRLMVNGKNSLQKQSTPNRQLRDGITAPFHYEDLIKGNWAKGNQDGFGFASYANGQTPVVKKDARPADDPNAKFDIKLKAVMAQRPDILMAHIRAASSGCPAVKLENNHPFQVGNWTLMHNGGMSGPNDPKVKQLLKTNVIGNTPQGDTDSEAALHLFLNKLKKQWGTLDTQVIGIDGTRKIFAQTIQSILAASPSRFKTLDGSVLGLTGKLESGPSVNLVATDGNIMLAYRHGYQLYLGQYTMPESTIHYPGNPHSGTPQAQYVISSEPVQAYEGKYPIKWLQLPEDTIVSLSRNQKGEIKPELFSLSALA